MRTRTLCLSALTLAACLAPIPEAEARDLTFEDRVAAQNAIEQVYWNHRIWPEANRGPKPARDPGLSDAGLRAKVENYLKESNALEVIWGRPITADQLQAELRRMGEQTRAPETLREIFTALGNDPFLIAETLARQALADRLLRDWYARDDRFHGAIRQRAETAAAAVSDLRELVMSGAEYSEATWVLDRPGSTPVQRLQGEVVFEPEEWEPALQSLGRPGEIRESDDGFMVAAVLQREPDSVRVATAFWSKTPFETWWGSQQQAVTGDLSPAGETFVLPELTAGSSCTPGAWTWMPGQPGPRSTHTVVWTGSEMIVWGGYDGARRLNSGWRYNPSTEQWMATSLLGAPSARMWSVAVWTGREMILWGGIGTDYLGDGGRYNPATDLWRATPTFGAPAPRYFHTGVWTGTEMIVWGGFLAGFSDQNTGGRYDPLADRWTATATAGAPVGRSHPTAVWSGSEMLVWGGSAGFGFPRDGARYDPRFNTWRAMTTAGAPSGRIYHTATWAGGRMLVWGGYDSNVLPTSGGRYDPVTDTWTAMTTTGAPSGRYEHTAVWTGSVLVVWGGVDAPSHALATGGRYDPSTDTWTATAAGGAPTARHQHTAVWTGSEVVVWGGDDADYNFPRYMNDGARYNPVSNTWRAVSLGPAPPARSGHSAVWTGSEMIIWGAGEWPFPALTSPGTGGRYDPATNTWTPTTIAGAPSARALHTAVWTGVEMIVWGGTLSNTWKDDGGRYNPAADAWVPTSMVGAPGRRYEHTAIWTGTEMIVWGGADGVAIWNFLNTGGRYDPATDRWAATSIAAAPIARTGHTAVWTGSEMIVWGGSNYDPFPVSGNSGGRYDPLIDHWVPTGGIGAPSVRFGHSAIWTGTEMIVWGGGDYTGTLLSNGARYRPASDAWTPTAGSGAPSGRLQHTAVWTGSDMIVWGGRDPFLAGLNTGASYAPATDSWVATPTLGAPDGRYNHSVIMTDTEMIVWNGYSGSGRASLGDGARLCVRACLSPATWYQDLDGDGYGNATVVRVDCDHPAGYADRGGDCDDADPSAYPGAIEVCDGHDDDCDGRVDNLAGDADRDGDQVSDACDDCPDLANPDQGDADHDAVGDACDDCPAHADPIQFDADADGLGDVCDNCPAVLNADQADANSDGSGDACQPGLLLQDLRHHGDRLEAVVEATDPQGDPLRGSVEIFEDAIGQVLLQNVSADYDCGKGYPLDGVAGEGIGYFSDPSGTVLFELDSSLGCADGRADYLLAFGRCDDAGLAFQQILVLTDLVLPADVCARRIGDSAGGHDLTITALNELALTLAVPRTSSILRALFDDGLPSSVDLAGLSPGETYRLVVTLTDGTTVPVTAARGFVYQGESKLVFVAPNTPPDALIQAADVVECTSPGGATVTLDATGSTDVDDDITSYEWLENPGRSDERPLGTGAVLTATLSLGVHRIGVLVADSAGATGTAQTTVTVRDGTPPTLAVQPDPPLLWPPNHRLVPVHVGWIVVDLCDPAPAVVLVSATSSEPDDDRGQDDGDTTGDIQGAVPGTPTADVTLRAERAGAGSGRAYELTYRAVDSSGNTATTVGVVTVPHDQGATSESLEMTLAPEGTTGNACIHWAAVPGSVGYDAISGDLRAVGLVDRRVSLGAVRVLARGVQGTDLCEADAGRIPPPGSGFYYLLQSRTEHGGTGYGTAAVPWPRLPESCEGGCP